MDKIIEILTPYEEEALISWIFRMSQEYTGNSQLYYWRLPIVKYLFGEKASEKPSVYIQSGLKHLVEKCCMPNSYYFARVEEIINKMTILPFYYEFLSADQLENIDILETICEEEVSIECKIGIKFSRRVNIEGNRYYKFCPKCLEEMRELYLLREHQIPGNLVCYKHGCVLKRIPHYKNYKYINALAAIREQSHIESWKLDSNNKAFYFRVAKMIHHIINNGFCDDKLTMCNKVRERLFENGYISEKLKFYNFTDFCESIGLFNFPQKELLMKQVTYGLSERSEYVLNPIIYIFMISGLFKDLDEYYFYETSAKTRELIASTNHKHCKKNITAEEHTIEYYKEKMNEDFWREYSVLGDTEHKIIVKHSLCGRIYRVPKTKHKLPMCKCHTKINDSSAMTGVDIKHSVCNTRYMIAKEYGYLYGKKEKQIRNYCNQGRILGVLKIGVDILIPEDAPYPKDRRKKK